MVPETPLAEMRGFLRGMEEGGIREEEDRVALYPLVLNDDILNHEIHKSDFWEGYSIFEKGKTTFYVKALLTSLCYVP